MTPPRTRAPARPYRKPTVRGEATKAQVRNMYSVLTEPRPEPEAPGKMTARCCAPGVAYQILRDGTLVAMALALTNATWVLTDLDERRLSPEHFRSPKEAASEAGRMGVGA